MRIKFLQLTQRLSKWLKIKQSVENGLVSSVLVGPERSLREYELRGLQVINSSPSGSL